MRLLRSPDHRALIALGSFALALLGCGSDAERPDGSTASASASASSGAGAGGQGAAGGAGASSGASGGSGGGGNGGGSAAAGGQGEIEYRAINLITGAPRFVLTKRDNDRDICFQLRLLMGAGDFATFQEPGIPFEELLVAPGADACGHEGDPAPVPPPTAAAAVDADGDISLSQPPCTVTASFTLAFDDAQPWVPASEPFDVQALPIEQGCP